MHERNNNELHQVLTCLSRLMECVPPLDETWLVRLREIHTLGEEEPAALWKSLNSKAIWGGAESLANQALNTNVGYDPTLWQVQVRQFREEMIALGELLQARPQHYPDISSWLLAFNNWNRANV